MVRSIKKGDWLINYEIEKLKVIKLLYSSKGFNERGWTYCEDNKNLVNINRG